MARWTKFLAIIGFIFLGLVVVGGGIMGLAIGTSMYSSQYGALGGLGAAWIITMCLLIAGLMFYPAYALFKYSTVIKTAINTNNKQKFNEAIRYLKNVFKYYGIITIIALGIYGLFVIMSVFSVIGK